MITVGKKKKYEVDVVDNLEQARHDWLSAETELDRERHALALDILLDEYFIKLGNIALWGVRLDES